MGLQQHNAKSFYKMLNIIFACYTFSQLEIVISSQVLCNTKGNFTIDQLLQNYDERDRPNRNGPPVAVTADLLFVKIQDINDGKGTYDADLYIRLRWNDPRLCHNEKDSITLIDEQDKDLWQPNIFFANALKSSKHNVLMSNHFTKVSPKGDVLSSTRVTVNAHCKEDLLQYPFDVQECSLAVESYSFSTKDIILKWNKEAVQLSQRELKQFYIKEYSTSAKNSSYSTGVFSSLSVHFDFERRIGYYAVQVFLPCSFVVLLSFASLWISPHNVGDRLAVGVTTVLTIVFLMQSINNHLPKVSYIKAIDCYLIGCFGLVFATVLETLAVYCRMHRMEGRITNPMYQISSTVSVKKEQFDELSDENKGVRHIGISTNVEDDKGTKENHCIDSYSKIIFPLGFFMGNIIYWTVNLHLRAHYKSR